MQGSYFTYQDISQLSWYEIIW